MAHAYFPLIFLPLLPTWGVDLPSQEVKENHEVENYTEDENCMIESKDTRRNLNAWVELAVPHGPWQTSWALLLIGKNKSLLVNALLHGFLWKVAQYIQNDSVDSTFPWAGKFHGPGILVYHAYYWIFLEQCLVCGRGSSMQTYWVDGWTYSQSNFHLYLLCFFYF